jgi:hypothetical protein
MSRFGGAVGFEGGQGEQVGVGQVGDVDVVADAGAVGGGIVVAEDAMEAGGPGLRRAPAGIRCDSGSWASPRVTPSLPALGRAGHVEVAQRGGAQAVNPVEPAEHVLHQQLGFAVGIGGLEARIFLNRHRLPARRRRRPWRKRPAAADRGPASPPAGSGWRRCCCGRRSPGWTMDSPASMRAAKCRTPSKGWPAALAE